MDDHYIFSVYKMLVYMGIDPSLLEMNIVSEDTDGNGKVATMLMGIPTTKVGVSIEQNETEAFIEDDWFVSPVALDAIIKMHEGFKAIEAFSIEHKRRSTMNATKQTSQHEQWLIDAVVKRGLPIPDRNYRLVREDGKELTTPDMAWPDLKIAFFVDGLWWHQSREDNEIVKNFLEGDGNKEYLIEHNKTRAEKDLSIRSEMSARGWRVLSCTDRDLENHVGIQKQIENIERTMDLVKHEQIALRKITEQLPSTEESADQDGAFSIEDLLS